MTTDSEDQEKSRGDLIFSRAELSAGDIVVVTCSHECEVVLLDDVDFTKYRSGAQVTKHGGHYDRFPVRLIVPQDGTWNVVINANSSGRVSHTIDFVERGSG